jgi:hypothetical protein
LEGRVSFRRPKSEEVKMMSETIRIRSQGGWLTVRFLNFGEIQVSGRTVQGVIIQVDDNTFPNAVEAKDVHPDDFKSLVNRFAKGKD